MKKTLLFVAFLLLGFVGFGQNEMPYIIQYHTQNDTIYHNTHSVDGIHIDAFGHELMHESETEWSSLLELDTVYVYRDKFKKLIGDIGDWDEVLFSNEQICLYKEGGRDGIPYEFLSIYINDSIPQGYFLYTTFDEEGNPDFFNFNDSCFMKINRYYGEYYYDATVISSDMSFFNMDSVRMEEGLGKVHERYFNSVRATPAEEALARQNCVLGAASMALGIGGIVTGCMMLVPGVNVAVGATIAIAGAATYLSGALLATHAMDQLISDGTHTEGFEEASEITGMLGSSTSMASFLSNLFMTGFSQYLGQSLLHEEANWPYELAERLRNMELTATGRAALLDSENHTVRLFGSIREKLNPNDRFGILVTRDPDAKHIEYCQMLESSYPLGEFYCDFAGLEPLEGYYYRSYYYATELVGYESLSPWFVSEKKSFKMPGVVTMEHEQGSGSSNSFWLHGAFQDVANQNTHTVGFCYSYTNVTPTYGDETMEQTVYENGEFTGHLFLNSEYNCCYYRAYAFIAGEIAYGEVRQIGVAVTTYEVENITSTTATGGGEVTDDGSSPVTERGICWSTSTNPTVNGNHAANGSGTGSFTVSMNNLTAGTTYHVRAYAMVGGEPVYGNEVSFRTDEPQGDWVDLGLPSGLLWATRNVGASSPEGYGDYFAWAETQPKSWYDWDNYTYSCHDDYYPDLTKYCNDSDYGCNGYTDNLTILQAGDDAATANWGNGCRTPTLEEWEELIDHCTSVWTTQNGVYGRRFTGPNGNTLFLPAAGYRRDDNLDYAGSGGYYWSSSLYTGRPNRAWYCLFTSGYSSMDSYYGRDHGHSVRAVRSARQK